MSAVVIPDGTKAQYARSARKNADPVECDVAGEASFGVARAAREEHYLLTFPTGKSLPADEVIASVSDTIPFDEVRRAANGELAPDVARAIAAYFTRAAARTSIRYLESKDPGTSRGGYLAECHEIVERYRRITGGPIHTLPLQLPEFAFKKAPHEVRIITVSSDGVVRVGRDAHRVGVFKQADAGRWRVQSDRKPEHGGWTTVVTHGGPEAQVSAIRDMVGRALMIDASEYIVKFTDVPDIEVDDHDIDSPSRVEPQVVTGFVRIAHQAQRAA